MTRLQPVLSIEQDPRWQALQAAGQGAVPGGFVYAVRGRGVCMWPRAGR